MYASGFDFVLCLAYSVLLICACCFAVLPSTPESHPNGDAGGLVITTVNQGAAADSTHLAESAALLSPTGKCRADWDSRFDDLISDAQATLRQKVYPKRIESASDSDGFVAGK